MISSDELPPGYMTWFDEVAPHFPVIDMHDSGLFCRHDQLCAVCGNGKAIYRMDIGAFYPCDSCHRKGWKLKEPKRWVPAWLRAALMGGE